MVFVALLLRNTLQWFRREAAIALSKISKDDDLQDYLKNDAMVKRALKHRAGVQSLGPEEAQQLRRSLMKLQSLFNRRNVIVHSLRNHRSIAAQHVVALMLLCNCCAVASKVLCDRFPLILQSLSCAIALILLCNRINTAVQSH
jgi:hypothetical protein